MKMDKSKELYREALRYMPGGVNSPVRAFKAVGGNPIFIRRGLGSTVFDEDKNEYIDYVMSWGAIMLGHCHPAICEAVRKAIMSGSSFGAPTMHETEFAKMIQCAIPSIEKIRLVNSGTEAVMSAIRLSRGYTKREKIIKFDGCYHGHCDGLLVTSGSGRASSATQPSAGITRSTIADTIVCPYNDIKTVTETVKKNYRDIACIIVEPVSANMGVVLPEKDFLLTLRNLTKKYGIVLIFDEVITGFRLRFGGIQDHFGVRPDLTCLGKIIGAGFPIGAYGGKSEIMDCVAPLGPVYQAGTLSGNPVAVRAGITALRELAIMDYDALNDVSDNLCKQIYSHLSKKKIHITINRIGPVFTVFFTGNKVTDLKSAKASGTKLYAKYFWTLLRKGIYMAPSQFEANFISFAHTDEDIAKTARAHRRIGL
jgi:glutamate-1-semialdehyde 2,1-aminomutase